ERCEQSYGFLPYTTTVLGNLFLVLEYAFVMYKVTMYLSAGSELLLEIMGVGLVGGLLLPILSALPDALLMSLFGLTRFTGYTYVSLTAKNVTKMKSARSSASLMCFNEVVCENIHASTITALADTVESLVSMYHNRTAQIYEITSSNRKHAGSALYKYVCEYILNVCALNEARSPVPLMLNVCNFGGYLCDTEFDYNLAMNKNNSDNNKMSSSIASD
ncbi:hypothetical protein ACJX0J_041082, partial [Zea mays]